MEIVEQRFWTAGWDCGEQKHRVVLLDEDCQRQTSMWVKNHAEDILDAIGKLLLLVPEGVELRMVTEGTRSVGGLLTRVVVRMGIQLWAVNPKALAHYRDVEGQPRKDDDRDAFLLGKMCVLHLEGCRLVLNSDPEERVLCQLARLHTQLVNDQTATTNRLRGRLLEVSPEIFDSEWEGPGYRSKGMLAVLERWPGFGGLHRARLNTVEQLLRKATRKGHKCQQMAKAVKEMASRIRLSENEREVMALELAVFVRQLRTLERSLAEVDARIRREVRQHPIAIKLCEIPGEGEFSAAVDVGEVLPLARHLDEGKVATYVGLTPLSRRSGKKGGRSRLARGVNKHAARSNYLSAVAARSVSAIDDAYYHKQLERHQGHPKATVKAHIALARQRFKLKYKLMTTDARYDKETLIASHLERQRREQQRTA